MVGRGDLETLAGELETAARSEPVDKAAILDLWPKFRKMVRELLPEVEKVIRQLQAHFEIS